MVSGQRERLGIEPFAQDDDVLVDAGSAQIEGLTEASNAEGIGGLESVGRIGQAMPVGIRLDDGQNRATRRGLADSLQVVP